jgi:hypothetical protein
MPLDDVKAINTAGVDATDAMKLHAEGISPSSAKSMIAAGCTVPVVIAFTKAGFGEEDTQVLHAAGIPAATAAALRYTGSTVDELVGYLMAGHSADSLLEFAAVGFTHAEMTLLIRAELTAQDGQAYYDLHLPINEDTIVGVFRQANLTEIRPLGSGTFNQVYLATISTPDGDGEGVFKPLKLNEADSNVGETMFGINHDDPKYGLRNLGAVAIDERLGFNVLTKTEFAMLKPPGSDPADPPVLGMVMETALGKPGNKQAAENSAIYDNPEVRRQLTMLQLVDNIIGQVDRHRGNYFIYEDPTTGAIQVKGIDNDQCFGKLLRNPDELFGRAGEFETRFPDFKLYNNAATMPQIIDEDMRDSINALTPENIRALLRGKVDDEEIAATIDRLTALKAHIAAGECVVIKPTDWGGDVVNGYVADVASYSPSAQELSVLTSYVVRDAYNAP